MAKWNRITNISGPKGNQGNSIVGPMGPAGRDGKDGESIVGPMGPQGPAGRDGKDSKSTVIHSVARKPENDFGNEGDWAISAFSELFHKEKKEWVFKSLLRGASAPGIKKAVLLSFDDDADRNTLLGDNVQEVLDKLFLPTESEKPTFAANGTLTTLEKFSTSNQVTANRTVRIEMTYNSDLNPTQEVQKFYDTDDGTTILKTVTKTYTWSSGTLTKVETATA